MIGAASSPHLSVFDQLSDNLDVVWGAIIALVVVVFLTPAVGGMARRLGIVDLPGGRRINTLPVPRLGGLALFLGLLVPALAFLHSGRENRGILLGAAIAVTVGHQGVGSLFALGKLVLTLYGALVIFVGVVLGAVVWLARVPLRPFVKAVREPFTLAFATANSEAALPKAFENMEKVGVPRGIVGFVLPAGYSFNLDGSTLHLAVASVFVAQAAEASGAAHFGLGQQVTMMLTLMLTSKGVAAVPRASFVVLVAALEGFGLPLDGAFLILGVDALLDMARTSVNVLGNCLASVVVARWEGEFDDAKARAFAAGEDPT